MNSALLGVAAALAWGTHDFLARFPSRAIGPVNALLVVTLAGLLVLSVWMLLAGAPIRIVWPWLWLVAATGIFSALATLWLFAALSLGPFSIVMPIAGSYPAFAMLFAIIGGTRPSVVEWLAIAAVMIGVAAVSRSSTEPQATDELQPGKVKAVIGFALLASFGFAASLTGGQLAAPIFGEVQTVWLARIFGLLTVGALYLRRSVSFQAPASWLPLLGLMGALDVGAFMAVVTASMLPNPAIATVASSAFGVVTVVLARLILKERIGRLQLAGIVLVFLGVAVLASR
jgi:drug/metabolite transporter (DMT)-like permease